MLRFIIYWSLSVIMLVGSLIWGLQRERRKNAKSVIFAGTFGVGSAVFLLRFYALFAAAVTEYAGSGRFYAFLMTVSRTFLHTLQTFSLDEDYELFLDKQYFPAELPAGVYDVYAFFYTVLNVVAPAMMLAFIMALLKELIAHIRTHLYPLSETYVFSELNECTVTMAEDLRKKSRNVFMLFTDAYVGGDDEQKSELFERAKRTGAVIIKEDIITKNLNHNPSIPITYVLADADENENLRVAAWLSNGSEKINKYNCVNVIVFCSGRDSGATVQAAINKRSNKNMRFFVVNTYLNQIYRLLIDHPLYERMDIGFDGKKKKCTVLVVGCGSVGVECIKAAAWCGQLPDSDLRIVAVSDDADEKEEYLKRSCPEFFTSGKYDMEFKNAEVFSSAFNDYVKENVSDACYVVVALEDDQRNISAAAELERLYNKINLRGGTAPQICYMVKDDNIFSNIAPKNDGVLKNECLMIPFGNNVDRYSMKSILASDFEKAALSVHLTYRRLPLTVTEEKQSELKKSFLRGERLSRAGNKGGKTVSLRYETALFKKCFPEFTYIKLRYTRILSFFRGRPGAPAELRNELSSREEAINGYYQSIYGQNSSRASAIHLRYKLNAAGIYPCGKITDDHFQTFCEFIEKPENSVRIAKLEHLRWSAYMRSTGYTLPSDEDLKAYAYKNENNHQNKKLLYHPCLVDWDDGLNVVLNDEDYELFECNDEKFINGRYKNELDELDRVSLKIWLLRKQMTGKEGHIDYKTDDEIIIRNVADILRSADAEGDII